MVKPAHHVKLYDMTRVMTFFKSIYANSKKADADHVGKQIEYFSGYLIDNYRAVLECKRIGYSTTFSILDSGYKKEDF